MWAWFDLLLLHVRLVRGLIILHVVSSERSLDVCWMYLRFNVEKPTTCASQLSRVDFMKTSAESAAASGSSRFGRLMMGPAVYSVTA